MQADSTSPQPKATPELSPLLDPVAWFSHHPRIAIGVGAFCLWVSVCLILRMWLIHRSARTIDGVVSRIWDVGQRVATNTVHIPSLYKTNAVAAEILATALNINAGVTAIETHAKTCSGCPQCMFRHQEHPA